MRKHFVFVLGCFVCISSTLALKAKADLPEEETRERALSLEEEVPTPEKKALAFALGRVYFLDTHGDKPYASIFYPDLGFTRVVKCSWDLEDIKALACTTRNYQANLKDEKKFIGGRDAHLGNLLAKIFLSHQSFKHPLKRKENGTVLIDEYEMAIKTNGSFVFRFTLRTTDELEKLALYLAKNFAEKEIASPEFKPLLAVSIDDDPELSELKEETRAFFDEYFQIVPLTDAEIKNFLDKSKKHMIKFNSQLESSKPIYLNESLIEVGFRNAEKVCHKFEAKKIIPAIVGFVFMGCIWAKYKRDINDWVTGWVTP